MGWGKEKTQWICMVAAMRRGALETFGKGKDGQWARLGCRIRLLYLGS